MSGTKIEDAVKKTGDYVSDQAEAATIQSRRLIHHNPLPATVVAFGLGVGAGLALVALLGEPASSRKSHITERLGRQLLDSVTNVMPESLVNRIS